MISFYFLFQKCTLSIYFWVDSAPYRSHILLLYNQPYITQKPVISIPVYSLIHKEFEWWGSLRRRWSEPDQIHSLTDQRATTDQETLQPKWEKTGGCWQIQFSEMTSGQGRNTTLCPCTKHIDKCIDKFAPFVKVIQRKRGNAFNSQIKLMNKFFYYKAWYLFFLKRYIHVMYKGNLLWPTAHNYAKVPTTCCHLVNQFTFVSYFTFQWKSIPLLQACYGRNRFQMISVIKHALTCMSVQPMFHQHLLLDTVLIKFHVASTLDSTLH